MSETSITQDLNMDVESLFNAAKSTPENSSNEEPVSTYKTPLQRMMETHGKGMVIRNVDDDGPKMGGSMTDERRENVEKTLNEMDELTEKAKLVGITKKPQSKTEMAELINRLDSLDIGDLRRASEVPNLLNVVKSDDVIGSDISSNTLISGSDGSIDSNGLFVPKSLVTEIEDVVTDEKKEPVKDDTTENTVSVIIEKTPTKEGDTTVIEFTDEEREKMTSAKQIEVITANTIHINTGLVTRPSEKFMEEYNMSSRKAIATSATMTFTASRFRATMRGLSFGEYMDLALSTEITEVETLVKKLTIFYETIVNTSIGSFTSFEDFTRNFAYKDLPFGTYCLYIATNPEVLELGLSCGVDTCKKNFTVTFNPRNLLVTSSLSERFVEIMEKTAMLDGREAMEYHNSSSIITKQVVELPLAKIGIEIGLRSCFDMINSVLPYINSAEDLMKEKYPNDTNKIREIISYVSNYVSAIYLMDETGEYTKRVDDIEDIVNIIYNIPLRDYEILSAIMNQTDEDYAYQFGVQNVVCPGCGNETKVVSIDLDQEVFRQFQELGSTRVDKKSLPRL